MSVKNAVHGMTNLRKWVRTAVNSAIDSVLFALCEKSFLRYNRCWMPGVRGILTNFGSADAGDSDGGGAGNGWLSLGVCFIS